MKTNKLKFSFFIISTLFMNSSLIAQWSGDKAFMIGDYVEIAINANGYEGANLVDSIPTHDRDGYGQLGFVSNPKGDGWIEYNGDFYMPGVKENGFGLTFTILGGEREYGNNAVGLNEIPGEIIDVVDNLDSTIIMWEGMVDSLEIAVTYSLKKDEHFYTTTVSLANLGPETITNTYYYRNIDADNNQDLDWGFATLNTIESQSGMSDDSVIISAISEGDWVAELIFNAYGPEWKGFYGGFSNRNGRVMWHGLDGLTVEEGSSALSDQAFGLSYHAGDFPPGKASAKTFSFETVFNREAFYSAKEVDDSSINEYELVANIYPNPVNNNHVTIALKGNFNYQLIDLKGQVIFNGAGYNTIDLELENLDQGIYIISLEKGNRSTKQKLIVQ